MITITRLYTLNWRCFRGDQVLDLEPKSYAVHARDEQNEGRSNFLGKTSLPAAVVYALRGEIPDDCEKKTDWISRGEKVGSVELSLSDGSRIVRSHALGGSEKLRFYAPGQENPAAQDEAQKLIDELVGLGPVDFDATRYLRQGAMARLIKPARDGGLDPADRIELVASWLRLEPVQGCADDVAELLRELARRRAAVLAQREAVDPVAALSRRGLDPSTDLSEEAVHFAALERDAAAVRYAEALSAFQAATQRAADRDAAIRYDEVVGEGKQLKAQLEGGRLYAAIVDDRAEAERATRQAATAVDRSASLLGEVSRAARGEFDGTCPIAGAPCPAGDFVSGECARNEARVAELRKAHEDERTAYLAAVDRQQQLVGELDQHNRTRERLVVLRGKAKELKPAYERWSQVAQDEGLRSREALDEAERAKGQAHGAHARLSEARAEFGEAMRKRAELGEELDRLDAAIRVAVAAAAIFGKGGAQRRLAEGALGEIEARACDMLAEAGTELAVEIRWSREGSGVASTCGACGEPFPRSERVKQCARCGAERGPNLIHKLEVKPSATSGGARDLAGIFVQFAAAEWLVADRGAQWGCAMLDEPLAALDTYHCRQLASHIPRMLSETGAPQALVIAHHDGFLESFPGKILVERQGKWSTMRVVA